VKINSSGSVAAIVLAAGAAVRFGNPKILTPWRGSTFLRLITEQALAADLDPVIVVLGAVVNLAKTALINLPVQIVENKDWARGQSSSIQAGIKALIPPRPVIFLLADQPQVTQTLLRSLVEEYHKTQAPIIAPLVQGKRGNPVLFSPATFEALNRIEGDQGGRAIFSQFPVHWLEWHDEQILVDIDTPSDLKNLGE